MSKGALSQLMHYHWPGNVRELSNTIFRTAAFCDGDIILPHHLHLGADSSQNDKKGKLRNGKSSKAQQPDVADRKQDEKGTDNVLPAVPQTPAPVPAPLPESISEAVKPAPTKVAPGEANPEPAKRAEASAEFQDGRKDISEFPRLQKLLPKLTELGSFSRKDYQELAQVSVRTAQYDLQLYVEEGYLERKGRGPSQRYLVAGEHAPKSEILPD